MRQAIGLKVLMEFKSCMPRSNLHGTSGIPPMSSQKILFEGRTQRSRR